MLPRDEGHARRSCCQPARRRARGERAGGALATGGAFGPAMTVLMRGQACEGYAMRSSARGGGQILDSSVPRRGR